MTYKMQRLTRSIPSISENLWYSAILGEVHDFPNSGTNHINLVHPPSSTRISRVSIGASFPLPTARNSKNKITLYLINKQCLGIMQ